MRYYFVFLCNDIDIPQNRFDVYCIEHRLNKIMLVLTAHSQCFWKWIVFFTHNIFIFILCDPDNIYLPPIALHDVIIWCPSLWFNGCVFGVRLSHVWTCLILTCTIPVVSHLERQKTWSDIVNYFNMNVYQTSTVMLTLRWQ